MFLTYLAESAADCTTIDDGARDLIGDNRETGVDEEFEVRGVNVCEADVTDFVPCLQGAEVGQIVKVGRVRVIPDVI